jgi:hypothetical protein
MPLYLLELTYRAYVEARDGGEAEAEFTHWVKRTEDPEVTTTKINSVEDLQKLRPVASEHDHLEYYKGYDGLWREERGTKPSVR